jgi:sugar phosphate permease
LAEAWKSYAKVLLLVAVLNVLVALLLVRGPDRLSQPALYALCFVAPVGAQVAGLVFVLARNLFPDDIAASAMGLINIFAIVPGALMQKIIGALLARGELLEPALSARELYSQAFMPLLGCVILGLPLALWQWRREKKSGLGRPH